MRLSPFAAAVMLCACTSLAVHADTLATTTTGSSSLGLSAYTGQAFTVVGTGSYTGISFNYYAPGLTPYALGTGYLLSSAYTGTPNDLSASASGYLGQSAAANGHYDFGSTVTLMAGQQYFVYENASILGGSITGNSAYAGSSFFASSGTSTYSSATAANFLVTGTSTIAATPEPSSLALLGTGVLGLVGAMKRRFRAVT